MLFVSSSTQFQNVYIWLACTTSTITVYQPTTSEPRSIVIDFDTSMSCELLQLTYRMGVVS